VSSKNYRTHVFFGLLVLVLALSGCDLINSIKEYFQEPSETSTAQPALPQKNVSAQRQAVQAPKAPAAMTPDTLARVGSWSITVKEFEERLDALQEVVPEYDITDPEARRLVLEELINQEVLVQGAEQRGLVNQKDIDAAVEEFRRTLIVREVARQLTENIEESEAEALAFYNENKEAMVGPTEWHVREIVVKTKEEATNILTELLKGGDFQEAAKLFSISETAERGGDLGFITEEPFPQMGSALLPLEEGDLSSVFKGPEGYYIVKLEGKRGGAPLTFEEIKTDIMETQLLQKQQEAILEHLERLKAKIPIEINEELLQQ